MTTFTGTVSTGPSTSLHVPSAAEMDTWHDALAAVTEAWTAYTPTLTAATTNPTGQTMTGSYSQAGKMITGRALATFAATVGTGSYFMTAPVACNEAVNECAGTAIYFDTSLSLHYPMAVFWISATAVRFGLPTTGANLTNTGVGVAVAVGDTISIKWNYEAA